MAIMFSAIRFWGNSAHIKTPKAVRVADDATIIEAICRSIARRNRPRCVANCRADGWSLDHDGKKEARHYELTIGTPLKCGGYAIEGQVWCAVYKE